MTVDKAELIKNRARINDLLEKLRTKLLSFEVVNLEGKLIGKIKDFSLDKYRRLYMIIPELETRSNPRVHLISSKYIQHVDTVNRLVVVDLSLTEIEQQPLYELSNPNNTKKTEPVKQVSTPSVAQPRDTSSNESMAVVETPLENQSFAMENLEELDNQTTTESGGVPEVVEEEIIRLLEERLVVNRGKRKVGEVVVRKEIETRIVEVPIHREKLIIEQVGAETKQLAEIDLGRGEVTGVEAREVASFSPLHQSVSTTSDSPYTVVGEFLSPKAASNLLEAIALQKPHGCQTVRVELVVDNPELQDTYQKMFDRCSIH